LKHQLDIKALALPSPSEFEAVLARGGFRWSANFIAEWTNLDQQSPAMVAARQRVLTWVKSSRLVELQKHFDVLCTVESRETT